MYALAQPSCRELLNDLLSLFKALKDFNSLHANGRQVGLLLSELIHSGTPEEIAALTRPLAVCHAVDFQAAFTTLSTQYSSTLKQTGLGLCIDAGLVQAREIFSDYGITRSPLGARLESVTLHVAELSITDVEQFIRFLGDLYALRPPFAPTSDSVDLFRCVAEALTATLERSDLRRKLGYPDSLAPDVLEDTQEIIEFLHEIRLSEVAEQLSEILQHASCSDLSDYLRAKRYNLLPQAEQGPKLWHRTMSKEYFESHWNLALQVIKDLAAGESSFLSQRVRDHLDNVARKAYQEISFALNTARPAAHFKEHGPGMLAVLTKALEALSSLRESK